MHMIVHCMVVHGSSLGVLFSDSAMALDWH